jgi:hypothetical protein
VASEKKQEHIVYIQYFYYEQTQNKLQTTKMQYLMERASERHTDERTPVYTPAHGLR